MRSVHGYHGERDEFRGRKGGKKSQETGIETMAERETIWN